MDDQMNNDDLFIFIMDGLDASSRNGKDDTPPVVKRKRPPQRKIPTITPRPLKRRREWKERPILCPPFKLDTLDDLLHIAWNYRGSAFDWFRLWKMIPALTELNQMVGMKSLKRQIIDLVLFYLSGLNEVYDEDGNRDEEGELLHTVLCGSPGCGKTSTAHILAKIYAGLGYLSSDKVTIIKRTDLVGKYIGHTEDKTMKVLEAAKGGVIFLDEAYSMGNGEKTESFSKTALDTINQFLTENKKDVIFMIAGYEEELEKCFFGVNPGLKRRFPWKFTFEEYSGGELYEMFVKHIRKEGWTISEDIRPSFFEDNRFHFKNAGGDVEILITRCKISHTRRIFGISNAQKRNITLGDLENAFSNFKETEKEVDLPNMSMYM